MAELVDLTYAGAEHWTCPGCLSSLPATTEGTHTCRECGAEVECAYERVEMSECQAALVAEGDK